MVVADIDSVKKKVISLEIYFDLVKASDSNQKVQKPYSQKSQKITSNSESQVEILIAALPLL